MKRESSMAEVDILLATYNGAAYLEEQINSILSQSYEKWRLIVRDDGSTDNTGEIINEYIKKYPHKISLLESSLNNCGINRNFTLLMESSTADYIMFSDQDDVWLPEKIEVTCKKMVELEKKTGQDVPLLVHSDLKVVDENVKDLSGSFWSYQKLDPEKAFELNRLLVQNVITGCTVMINKKLKELLLPVPEDAIMYDWWAGLVACAFGKIGYIKDRTILYRQHGRNDTGAKNWGKDYILRQIFNLKEIKKTLLKTQVQAKIFLDRYEDMLEDGEIEKIMLYSSLDSMNPFKKRFYLFKYKFFKIGFIRNIGMFLVI